MINKNTIKFMENRDKCYKEIQQSNGIKATELGSKLKIPRESVYKYLNNLQATGKIESKNGLWHPTKTDGTKEETVIRITLPVPKKDLKYYSYIMNNIRDTNGCSEEDFRELEDFTETHTIYIGSRDKNALNIIADAIKKIIQ
jgi:hypothetical protein